ncbi:MAG: hypothetical protein MJ078_04190, partial [Clostridia bacterium]|nr:hypothetical protein [Clostridia bacterium]
KEEAVKLYRTVKAHPELKFTTGENCCYFGCIRSWKQMAEEGKLGRILFGEAEYLHGSGVRPQKETWRSHMASVRYLTHSLGPLLYATGDTCKEVSGFAPDFNPYEGVREYPNSMAVLKTEKGALLKVYMGFGGFFPCSHNYALHGTEGALQVQVNLESDDPCPTLAHFKSFDNIVNFHGKQGLSLPLNLNNTDAPRKAGTHGDCDSTLICAFADAVANDTPAPLDFDFGYAVTMPGIIAEESIRKGGVPLPVPSVRELEKESR